METGTRFYDRAEQRYLTVESIEKYSCVCTVEEWTERGEVEISGIQTISREALGKMKKISK